MRTAWINVRWTPTLSPPALATVTGSRTLPAGPVHLARLGSTSPECALEGTSSKTTQGSAVRVPRRAWQASSCQGRVKQEGIISMQSSALLAARPAKHLARTCTRPAMGLQNTRTPTTAGRVCPVRWEGTCPPVLAGTEVPGTAAQGPAACANPVKQVSTFSPAAGAMAVALRIHRPARAAVPVPEDLTFPALATACLPSKHALYARPVPKDITGWDAMVLRRRMTCSAYSANHV